MSGRGRLALCAAAATLMTACSLLPLATPNSWILQAVFLVLLQTGVGALARRVPLARPLTVLAQAVFTLLVLTLMFASEQAVLGFLPGPAAYTRFGNLLTAAMQDVTQFAIPAPVTPGIRLLLLGGVLLIGLIVDALAVTYGSAAPAGLPLLALYSIAAGLAGGDGTRWPYFLLAAVGYLLLLLAEGRDRISRWGRVFGGVGSGARAGYGGPTGAVAPVRTGRRIGALALGIALVAPAVLPSMGVGLLPTGGSGTGNGRGGGTISAVNPVVALQDNLNQSDDRVVLRYRTNAVSNADMYLRIVALDRFTGDKWEPAQRSLTGVPKVLPSPQGLGPDVKATEVATSVAADKSYVQMWLPLPYPATQVQVDGRWRYEPTGRTIIGDRGQTTSDTRYQVSSLALEPTAQQLASAPPADARLRAEYTKVPDSLPDVVARTAMEVTKDATNDYERAVALQRWFTSGAFSYDTSVRSGTGVQAITRFLRNKEGFCIHFAFTMAAMARTLGIPARVAVGFTPGTAESDGAYAVGLKDAHAWPELYFEGVGWTRFEPTPTRGTVPGYTQDTAASDTGPSVPDTPEQSAGTGAGSSPSASPSCLGKDAQLGNCDPLGQASGIGTEDERLWPRILEWTVRVLAWALLPLVVLLLLLPLLWRRRQRFQRLHGGQDPAALAAWLELTGRARGTAGADGDAQGGTPRGPTPDELDAMGARDGARTLAAWLELIDTAWDYGLRADESDTARRVAARLIRDGGLEGPAAEAARRLATAVEQALFSPRPPVTTGSAKDVRLVREGLSANADVMTRIRAVLLPRSTVRIVWRSTERWSAGSARLSARLRGAGDGVLRQLRQRRSP
ncbi:transglutaminase TgpA family protein [Actinacidiphila sp. bgisy160]|uniref:transglutaminase TgpA family protein n=1 Tax=Actinacidiphila sp. bgisy160 TaxID=3413796 RepID=UPI003D73227C